MKPEELFFALEDIDEKYVTEAAPKDKRAVKRRIVIKRTSLIAACLAFLFLNLWLFIPAKAPIAPDISALGGSPYYGLIEKLNAITNKSDYYKNNFDRVRNEIGEVFSDKVIGGDINLSPPSNYKEIYYLQLTARSIDPDIISSTEVELRGDDMYVLQNGELELWKLGGEEPYLTTEFGEEYKTDGMFLSNDGNKAVIRLKKQLVCVELDSEESRKYPEVITFNGTIMNTWMLNGKLIVVTTATVGENTDFNAAENYMPQISKSYGAPFQYLQNNTMVIPEEFSSADYCTVMLFDFDTMVQESAVTFYSVEEGGRDCYITKDSLYFKSSYNERRELGLTKYVLETKSVIRRLKLEGKMMEYCGKATVDGGSGTSTMNETDGLLRVVSENSERIYKKGLFGDRYVKVEESLSLHFIDADDGMRIINSVEDFSTDGRLCSVNFEEDTVYVHGLPHGAETYFSPLYVLDTSDVMNVTCNRTVEGDGYSPYLIDFGEYYVGIPMLGFFQGMRIELYKEDGDALEQVDWYESERALSNHYSQIFIDRKKRLLGMCMVELEKVELEGGHVLYPRYSVFVIFKIEDGRLNPVHKIKLIKEEAFERYLYVDGMLYMYYPDKKMPVVLDVNELLQKNTEADE